MDRMEGEKMDNKRQEAPETNRRCSLAFYPFTSSITPSIITLNHGVRRSRAPGFIIPPVSSAFHATSTSRLPLRKTFGPDRGGGRFSSIIMKRAVRPEILFADDNDKYTMCCGDPKSSPFPRRIQLCSVRDLRRRRRSRDILPFFCPITFGSR